jgi:hypothetical protein
MSLLFWEAYWQLISFDFYVTRGDFAGLHQKVRLFPVQRAVIGQDSIERICSTVDLAIVCYWKKVRCLQRSAATVCLLKRYGLAAELVIGAQQVPLKAHAWVEVEGRVVNDQADLREVYAVLDRC